MKVEKINERNREVYRRKSYVNLKEIKLALYSFVGGMIVMYLIMSIFMR